MRCTGNAFLSLLVTTMIYKEQFIGDEQNRLKVQLPAIELTYWILRDYGIEFDELRFVEKYIKEEPLYDMFQRTGTIPDKYIIKGE